MPNTSSAIKALRGSQRKKAINQSRKTKVSIAVRNLRKILATKPEEYQEYLNLAFSQIDKAVKRNIFHRNKANRKKSRLSRLVSNTLNQKTKAEIAK